MNEDFDDYWADFMQTHKVPSKEGLAAVVSRHGQAIPKDTDLVRIEKKPDVDFEDREQLIQWCRAFLAERPVLLEIIESLKMYASHNNHCGIDDGPCTCGLDVFVDTRR